MKHFHFCLRFDSISFVFFVADFVFFHYHFIRSRNRCPPGGPAHDQTERRPAVISHTLSARDVRFVLGTSGSPTRRALARKVGRGARVRACVRVRSRSRAYFAANDRTPAADHHQSPTIAPTDTISIFCTRGPRQHTHTHTCSIVAPSTCFIAQAPEPGNQIAQLVVCSCFQVQRSPSDLQYERHRCANNNQRVCACVLFNYTILPTERHTQTRTDIRIAI